MGILEKINQFVWGIPALLLILGVGLYLTVITGFVQFRYFPEAIKRFFKSMTRKGDSQYRALCTALAATVGTGNVIGVAGAIVIGGPGAMFWMWICAVLGMATKFAEATLAVRYRVRNEIGEYTGGPMYIIRCGLGKRWHWLAVCYSVFGLIASFGVGNATQVNTCVSGINALLSYGGISVTKIGNLTIGILIALTVAGVLFGGVKRIGDIVEKIVPFAAVGYVLLCAVVLSRNYTRIPAAFGLIFQGAFSPRAATGGLLGSAFCALRIGAARGTFTNEAGMGTASIAHANAEVVHPAVQGLMGIMEVFLDTICICTMTALVILCSGIPVDYGMIAGGMLTMDAFSFSLGDWSVVPLSLSLCCFGVATVF